MRIVGIGGTTRENSSSERMVRAVLTAAETLGATTQMFGGPNLALLPHFAPERPERTPEQNTFVEAVRQSDALVISSPGYHGGISGLVKNAIDLLEDLRADSRCYFEGRPVGLIVTAAGWQACGVTLQALRGVVHAMRGWPTPMGITVNSAVSNPFAEDGSVIDASVSGNIRTMAVQLLSFQNQKT